MFHRFYKDGSSRIIDLRDLYLGESLFIIAGSPAARKEQLTELYKPGIVTLAINNAATMVRPNFWVGGDRPECYSPSILTDVSITKFAPFGKHTMTCCGEEWRYKPSTLFFDCGDKGYTMDNLFTKHNHVVWWKNTWWIALSLAYTLGFRTFYLVGAEFNINKNHQYAWDTKLSDKAISSNVRLYSKTAEHMIKNKDKFFKSVKIYNCCQPSALTDTYGYISVENAVKIEQRKLAVESTVDRPHSLHN